MPTTTKKDRLKAIAHRLATTDALSSTVDGASFSGAQMTFLCAAGVKPVSEFYAGHWTTTPGGRQATANDLQEVTQLLRWVGIAYRVTDQTDALKVEVATDWDMLDRYEHVTDHQAVGELYGYPQTAVEAFIARQTLPAQAQDALAEQAGVRPYLIDFMLSKTHWKAELEVVRAWQKILTDYGLLIDGSIQAAA